MSGVPIGERVATRVHFGPRALQEVPLTAVHELQQVRTSYDPEGINELATSMVLNPEIEQDADLVATDAFDLNTPIMVAHFSNELAARRYIHDYAAHYGVDPVDIDSLIEDDGTVKFLIAGHRRKRALYQLADRFNIDPDDITVSASVYEDPSFAEALRLQLSENVHERPPVQDEARAIERFYRDVVSQQGTPPPIREFASQLGFGETKVRDALAFASLPGEIQGLTDRGLVSYSIVKRFKPLQDAYERLYRREQSGVLPEELSELVRDSLMTDAARLLSSRLDRSETRANIYIDNITKAVEARVNSQTPLFEWASQTPKQMRDRAAQKLSRQAVQSLQWQVGTGDLAEAELQRLEALRDELDQLLRDAKDKAASTQELELNLFEFDEQTG